MISLAGNLPDKLYGRQKRNENEQAYGQWSSITSLTSYILTRNYPFGIEELEDGVNHGEGDLLAQNLGLELVYQKCYDT